MTVEKKDLELEFWTNYLEKKNGKTLISAFA